MTSDEGYLLDNRQSQAGSGSRRWPSSSTPRRSGTSARLGIAPGWRCWEVGAGGASVAVVAGRPGRTGRPGARHRHRHLLARRPRRATAAGAPPRRRARGPARHRARPGARAPRAHPRPAARAGAGVDGLRARARGVAGARGRRSRPATVAVPRRVRSGPAAGEPAAAGLPDVDGGARTPTWRSGGPCRGSCANRACATSAPTPTSRSRDRPAPPSRSRRSSRSGIGWSPVASRRPTEIESTSATSLPVASPISRRRR